MLKKNVSLLVAQFCELCFAFHAICPCPFQALSLTSKAAMHRGRRLSICFLCHFHKAGLLCQKTCDLRTLLSTLCLVSIASSLPPFLKMMGVLVHKDTVEHFVLVNTLLSADAIMTIFQELVHLNLTSWVSVNLPLLLLLVYVNIRIP